MAVFPDSVDKQTPMIGYLPGAMPWRAEEKLRELGANVVNLNDANRGAGSAECSARDGGRYAALA